MRLFLGKNPQSSRDYNYRVILDDDFKNCIEQSNVPVIYCLNRKQLGTALLNQTSRIGIVGILKLDGVQEVWIEIMEIWKSFCCSWIEKYEKDCLYLWTASFYGHTDLLKRMNEL